jgi:O-antigen/teichoic acid export membrane protein
VVRFQSWQAVLQFGAAPLAEGRREDFQRVVRFGLVLDLISAGAGMAVGVLGALLVGPALGLPEHMRGEAAVYALTIATLAPASHVGLLRLFDRFALLSMQQAISSAVRLAGGLIGFAIDAPIGFFLITWGAGSIAAFAYVAFFAWRELVRRDLLSAFPWSGPLTAGMPGAWRFAWATNASSTLDVAFTHVATLTVGAVVGATDAGLWRVARQIADALAKPARLLIPALYPELARARAAGQEAAMHRLAIRIGLAGGGFATLLLVVAIFAGEPLLRVVMGDAFAAAAPTMIWQVGAAVIGVWALPLEPMLVSMGRPGAVVRVRLIVAAVFLVALPPVIDRYGLEGGGAVLVAAAAATALGLLVSLRRLTARSTPMQ